MPDLRRSTVDGRGGFIKSAPAAFWQLRGASVSGSVQENSRLYTLLFRRTNGVVVPFQCRTGKFIMINSGFSFCVACVLLFMVTWTPHIKADERPENAKTPVLLVHGIAPVNVTASHEIRGQKVDGPVEHFGQPSESELSATFGVADRTTSQQRRP
jgi:hypothetical protein